MLKMKMLKMLSKEEVSEYVVNSEVFEESGVYKVKLNDDCEVISKELVEESVLMNKDVKYYVNNEFCIDDENYEYYKVEVLSKEERLVEMVSSVEEELNEDFMDLVESEVEENCDLYIVKEEGEYKDYYVLMCYDYGDSLCEIEVSKNRGDLV